MNSLTDTSYYFANSDVGECPLDFHATKGKHLSI